MAQVLLVSYPLVYDQIYHISLSKQSGPWPGSSQESRLIWIDFCLQNILKPPNAHMAQVQLVYDQIFHIPISKQSGPWPGSSHESRQIWIHFVTRNVLEPSHEHIAKVPLVSHPLMYDQIFHIPISKQSRPYSGSSQESCLIRIYFVYKGSRPWSGSSHKSRLIRIYFVYKNV